ncbi:stalk domain-containing protein [Cohnella caldifontis]|uniref:stalk domain-containing protein n=1 Tax=Cohnella caldifontis TaxID=3027471 RepID=UPI0023EAE890|nr:stalk domain-containing protein [Cohnella sp. YIM B05605]
MNSRPRWIRRCIMLLLCFHVFSLIYIAAMPAAGAVSGGTPTLRSDLYINGERYEGAVYNAESIYVPLDSIVARMGDSLVWIEKPYSARVNQSGGKWIQINVGRSNAIVGHANAQDELAAEVPVSEQVIPYGSVSAQANPKIVSNTLYVPYDTIENVLGYPVELQENGLKATVFVGKMPDLADIAAEKPDFVHQDQFSPNETWTAYDPHLGADALADFIYGNQEYVAIGAYGTYAVSKDGKQWNPHSRIGDYYLSAIVWTGSRYVMWGSPGNNPYAKAEAFFSSDGMAWTRQLTDMPYGLTGAVYAFDRFFGINNYGQAYLSADGMKWKTFSRAANWNDNIAAFRLVNGTLFALSASNQPFVAISKDGRNWKEQALSSPLSEVIWNGKQYIGVGDEGVFASPDGLKWTKTSQVKTGVLYDIDYNGSLYVGMGYVGQNGSKQPIVFTSKDLKTWEQQVMPGGQLVGRVLGSEKGFVGVSTQGSSRKVVYGYFSKDGRTWGVNFLGTPAGFRSKATDGKRYVFVGEGGAVVVTDDGIHYQKSVVVTSQGAPDFQDVIWDGRKFVATGSGGVYLSSDGLKWRFVPIQSGSTSETTFDIYWNGKQLVAFGLYGRIFTSPDGEKWTKIYKGRNGFTGNWDMMMWDGKKYIATWEGPSNQSQKLKYSPDGVNWKDAVMPKGFFKGMVVAKNSKGYIAVDGYEPDRILISQDGMTWKMADNNMPDCEHCLTTGIDVIDDQFVIFYGSVHEDLFVYSADGKNWTAKPLVKYPDETTYLIGGVSYLGKINGAYMFSGGKAIRIPDMNRIEPYTLPSSQLSKPEF